ncbi:MAG TPA: metallophosphoesterase [Candidatus Paceibacterota bacterium]|nr:metallophosphoesterase [Candidatus Paceibacterota bacterium]
MDRKTKIYLAANIAVLEVLLLIVHFTVYKTLSIAFGFDSFALRVAFGLLSVTFFTSFIIVRFSRNRLAQWYYTASGYWFGLVHFLFVGAVIFYVVFNIFNDLNIATPLATLGIICFAPFFLIHLYGTWNSVRAQVTPITMKVKNLPEFWKNHKLVFVSDVHLGAVYGKGFSRKVVNRIMALNPATVIIGGDLYDGPKCDAEAIVQPWRDLKPPHGVHYITGNHEFYGEFDRFMAAIKGVGINILKNQTVEIEGMQFVGVDYNDTHKRENFEAVLEKIELKKDMPAVLIKHEPDNLDVAEKKGFVLGFFGHTHQGQIYPLTHITKRIYNGFDYGYKMFKTLGVYTSSGAGSWGPPLRLGTRSEIVLVSFA